MKRIFLLFAMIAMTALVYAAEAKKVAILEVVDKEGKLTYSQKLMLRSNLSRAVTNTAGFEAYDRSDIDAIFTEHDFQRTGNVSAKEIKKLGEMTGAAYILVTEGVIAEDDKVFVTAKVLNVETTKVEVTDNALIGTSSAAMQRGCRSLASKMFGSLAGASTATNKFVALFTKGSGKGTAEAEGANGTASAANKAKADQAAREAEAKEQRRAAAEKAKQERAEAQRAAIEQNRAAAEKARQERATAKANAEEQKRLAKEREEADFAERSKYFISKIGTHEYEYMGTSLDKKAYENFLQNNCPAAYAQHKKGKKLIAAGWGLFVPGVVLAAGGGACLALYSINSDMHSLNYGKFYYPPYEFTQDLFGMLGACLTAAGGTMVLTSIPLLGVGYSKRNNAYKTYNNKCASPDKRLSLNMTAGAGGLGLALQF